MTSCVDDTPETNDGYSSDSSTTRLKPHLQLPSSYQTDDNNASSSDADEKSSSADCEHTIPLKPASTSFYGTSDYLSNSSAFDLHGCGSGGASSSGGDSTSRTFRKPRKRSARCTSTRTLGTDASNNASIQRIRIIVNVYDLHRYNEKLHPIGLGLYHTGVQIQTHPTRVGREYSYGGNPYSHETGVFVNEPRNAPYPSVYRCSLHLGDLAIDPSRFRPTSTTVTTRLNGRKAFKFPRIDGKHWHESNACSGSSASDSSRTCHTIRTPHMPHTPNTPQTPNTPNSSNSLREMMRQRCKTCKPCKRCKRCKRAKMRLNHSNCHCSRADRSCGEGTQGTDESSGPVATVWFPSKVACLRKIEHILGKLRKEFIACEYNMLHKNCNHFSNELVSRLLPGQSLPSWINRMASIGEHLQCCIPKEVLNPMLYLDPSVLASHKGSDSSSAASPRAPNSATAANAANAAVIGADAASNAVTAGAARNNGRAVGLSLVNASSVDSDGDGANETTPMRAGRMRKIATGGNEAKLGIETNNLGGITYEPLKGANGACGDKDVFIWGEGRSRSNALTGDKVRCESVSLDEKDEKQDNNDAANGMETNLEGVGKFDAFPNHLPRFRLHSPRFVRARHGKGIKYGSIGSDECVGNVVKQENERKRKSFFLFERCRKLRVLTHGNGANGTTTTSTTAAAAMTPGRAQSMQKTQKNGQKWRWLNEAKQV